MPTGLLSDRLARIEHHLQEKYIDTGRLAGALTLVSRGGEIGLQSCLGEMDVERGKPVRDDTIFRILSMSKSVTSVALMMLYEEGRFQLSDSVSRFIPSWKDMRVWASGGYPNFVTKEPDREITIRDVLSHQSGLSYGSKVRTPVEAAYDDLLVTGRNTVTLAELSDQLSRTPLLFSPGSHWNYSISVDMSGHLVELISGQSFDQFLQERIFGPLSMVDTGFSVPDSKLDRFAAGYSLGPDGKFALQDDPETSEYRTQPRFLTGGGGLVSTVADFHRFCLALLGRGELDGTRLLGRKTVDLMTSNHLPNNRTLRDHIFPGASTEIEYGGTGFGLGLSVLMDPAAAQVPGSVGQFGWRGGNSTAFWIDPVEEVVVIFLVQLSSANALPFRNELQALVNQALA